MLSVKLLIPPAGTGRHVMASGRKQGGKEWILRNLKEKRLEGGGKKGDFRGNKNEPY